jgi:hypothetical protein
MGKTALIVAGKPFESVTFEITQKVDNGFAPTTVVGACNARTFLRGTTAALGWVRSTKALNELLEASVATVEKARKAKKSVKKVVAAEAYFDVEADGKVETYRVRPEMSQLLSV